MIKKLLGRVLPNISEGSTAATKIPFKKHGVARERISACARKVTSGLQEEGFAAFVVGGAVRDLLLGREPKDFDVATNASPEEVRALFRRSRIIGRRFRLVHVMCADEVIEVSTFRGVGEEPNSDEQHADEHGRILRDNVFGNQQEDAARRDFTVNALFYNPTTQEILDYHGGYTDLQARILRIIGDPQQRYREDPVRMLRAVRLAAKLGMHLEQATREPINEMAALLHNVPAARLFDEMLKLLLSGYARECVVQLRKEGLHHGLLPMLDVILEQPLGERFVMLALQNTDQRVLAEKPVSPGFLFAALLWHDVLAEWKIAEADGVKPLPALYQAMDQVIKTQAEKLAIPRRFGTTMKEIWSMQPRLLNRTGRRAYRVLEHPRFRAGFDFLMLRCESGEIDPELGQWWEEFQHADEARRVQMVDAIAPARKRKRRSKKAADSEQPAVPDTIAE